ncbi:long-chain-fatty-acid--CoA ligase [Ilumatobacter nonamiensis]|uniref:long-chain-fatty-acid--CoA ligase n=1 Tax=Ilumatobacter nonamiensis TaxID=467093 RepID=UPI0003495658|nr:long-chain-fatty-acid--CoA ligase [Ilumatobacter nonamiensis]
MSLSEELAHNEAALETSRRMTLSGQLLRAARKYPERVAYSFEGRTTTFGELAQRVERLAGAAWTLGVRPGDRIATLLNNDTTVVEAYAAASRIGAICVPINFRLVGAEIGYIIEDSDPKILISDPQLEQQAAAGLAVANSGIPLLVTREGSAAPGAIGYETLLAAATPPPAVPTSEDDVAFIMYTSGTTGRPKGAMLTHFNLLMNTFNSMVVMGISDADEVWLSGLPLFHIGGLNGILPYLMLGAKVVLMPTGDFDAEQVVETFESEQVTGCYLVPTQWEEVCGVPEIDSRNLALRRISWGASPAPRAVLESMAATFPGVAIFNAFGQTEMSSVTCVLRGEDSLRKMGSVGQPVANVEVRLVDDAGEDVPVGEIGEIVYRGPTVLQGYWNDEERTAEAFDGGWFHSGDLCTVDEDGFYYVVDRKKDMIISGGENIYSAEVEAVLATHPKVREVAVIGEPHERWVETPVAIVVPHDADDAPTLIEIQEHCRAQLASYKKPTAIRRVDSLPRNASGKVVKHILRTQASGGE